MLLRALKFWEKIVIATQVLKILVFSIHIYEFKIQVSQFRIL